MSTRIAVSHVSHAAPAKMTNHGNKSRAPAGNCMTKTSKKMAPIATSMVAMTMKISGQRLQPLTT